MTFPYHPSTDSMPSHIRISDLHPAYHDVTEDEAIHMANMGAICYLHSKTELFNQWTSSTNSEESAKVRAWTEEGRLRGREEMLESLKAKLISAEILQERLVSLEAARAADQIRSESRFRAETERLTRELADSQQTMESEIHRRIAESSRQLEEKREGEAASLRLQLASLSEELQMKNKKMNSLEKGFEEELVKRIGEARELVGLSLDKEKAEEISLLKQQVAEGRVQATLLSMTEESRRLLLEKLILLEGQLAAKEEKIQQLTASNTKSSWAIGKSGESRLLDIIHSFVLPEFLYSSVLDMAGVAHAADLHLFVQSPVGKRMKILIDSKKYKDPVRQKEINKLHSDVDRDDEAIAGLLISFDSPISNVKQFQVEKTTRGKHVMYLSVEGFDDALRGVLICWAVRVLSTMASYSDDSDVNIMAKVTEFVMELDKSVKDADKVTKACQTALESATAMKSNLVRRLDSFRIENQISVMAPAGEVDISGSPVEEVPKRRRRGANKPVVTLSVSEESAKPSTEIPEAKAASRRRPSLKKGLESMGTVT
jgi:hypothetical protein